MSSRLFFIVLFMVCLRQLLGGPSSGSVSRRGASFLFVVCIFVLQLHMHHEFYMILLRYVFWCFCRIFVCLLFFRRVFARDGARVARSGRGLEACDASAAAVRRGHYAPAVDVYMPRCHG